MLTDDAATTAWFRWHGWPEGEMGEDCPNPAICCDGFVAGWQAHAEAKAVEIARLKGLLHEAGERLPFTSDDVLSYCFYCDAEPPGGKGHEEGLIEHAADCWWVRARAALAGEGA